MPVLLRVLNFQRVVSCVACTRMGCTLIVRVLYMVIGGCAQARSDLDAEWMGLFFVMGVGCVGDVSSRDLLIEI